ncbi:MAG: hypothetical protein NUV80_04235 [Candidatus Berkelbacteria bacterium]|nr:hypothetical protein [Candidatus Berkelbacteria bacterium]
MSDTDHECYPCVDDDTLRCGVCERLMGVNREHDRAIQQAETNSASTSTERGGSETGR